MAKAKPQTASLKRTTFTQTQRPIFNNSCDCPECEQLTEPYEVRTIGDNMVRCYFQCNNCGYDWDRKKEPSNTF